MNLPKQDFFLHFILESGAIMASVMDDDEELSSPSSYNFTKPVQAYVSCYLPFDLEMPYLVINYYNSEALEEYLEINYCLTGFNEIDYPIFLYGPKEILENDSVPIAVKKKIIFNLDMFDN